MTCKGIKKKKRKTNVNLKENVKQHLKNVDCT